MQTGQADITNRTFDLHNLPETDASLSISATAINWTYKDADNNLVRYSKAIPNPTHGTRGDYIVTSPCKEQVGGAVLGGFGCVSKQNVRTKSCIGKLLTDSCDTAKFTTRTFVDSNGVTRTAILVPVSM